MPNLEDCIIQFEDPNPTMTRVENAPAGVDADIVFPSVEPEHLRGSSLSAVRPMTVAEYNNITQMIIKLKEILEVSFLL